ncbi:MAG TPA: DsbA family protein [Chlamydiales bacterium]|jgi:protein-disulfide isomerase
MGSKRSFQQVLILVTAAMALCLISGAALFQVLRIPDALEILTKEQPTTGNRQAQVEVVVFEDFLCSECLQFNETIFPQIEEKYIGTNEIRYTLIPVSFIDHSKPIANAALAVYKLAPTRFFAYAHALFRYFGENRADSDTGVLLKIADEVGEISQKELLKAIQTEQYYPELDQNLYLAKRLMGTDFGTPALYVNGIATPTGSFRSVQVRIDRALYMVGKK